MAKANLQDAIDEILATIRAVPGIQDADTPSEQIPEDPAAMAYSSGGTLGESYPAGMNKSLHDIVLLILTNYSEMSQSIEAMQALYEPVTDALLLAIINGPPDSYDTWSNISYLLGETTWAGEKKYGYTFVLEGVKITRVI